MDVSTRTKAYGISKTTEVSVSDAVPPQIMNLANALAKIHGNVHIAAETSGIHLYMASPEALLRDGDVELLKRHLAVNAERYCRLGKWKTKSGTYDADKSGYCMKYSVPYTLSDLLSWQPLEARGIKASSYDVVVSSTKKRLQEDENGNLIPYGPGACLELSELSPDHHAIKYLEDRGYNPKRLATQFRVNYCIKELHNKFRKLPNGMCDTPQGRLIFYCDIKGVQEGWQARLIDKTEGDVYSIWHPYKDDWEVIKTKVDDKWVVVPEYKGDEDLLWDPSKYKTSPGASRNAMLMGVDHAVLWNKAMYPGKPPVCVLVEGPLDAARFPMGVAALGKFFSPLQSHIVAKNFRKVIHIADNDAPGRKAKQLVANHLASVVDLTLLDLPKGVGDPGNLTYDQADAMVAPYL